MTYFQLVALPVLLGLLAVVVLRIVRAEGPRRPLLAGAGVLVLAIAAVAWPEMTTLIARSVGIGRGADLVLYVLAIAFIVMVFWFYGRYRKLSSEITAIVRKMAIDEAVLEDGSADETSRHEERPTSATSPTEHPSRH